MKAGGDVVSDLGITELADVCPGGKDPFPAGDHHGARRRRDHVFRGGVQLGENGAATAR